MNDLKVGGPCSASIFSGLYFVHVNFVKLFMCDVKLPVADYNLQLGCQLCVDIAGSLHPLVWVWPY